MFKTILVETQDSIGILKLNRPETHNAFDDVMVGEITRALKKFNTDNAIRAVVVAGMGENFCSGADLKWMKRMASYTAQQNLEDSKLLATMLHTLYTLSKPTIARVQGAAFGGGAGLIACCDIAFAVQDASFSFSEVKLGLIPATIAPYVVKAIGPRHAKRYFLTAERFPAAEAYRMGLVHDIVPTDELDQTINQILHQLLKGGPKSQAAAKDLVDLVERVPISLKLMQETAKRIATIRASAEGKEGIAAFLEKRSAKWVEE